MANKKVNQLTSKPSVNLTDLFLIADPTSGQAFKTTISDLGTAIGSGVSSVNSLVGAVVLDTDDIQELVSPTNKWFTDTRARAALSASSPLTYNSGTGAFGIQVANGSQNGYLSSADWTTFNSKQAALSGTGFVKSTGGTISYDTNTYLTTANAAATYLPLGGGTMTGALFGASASFSGYVGFGGNTSPLYPVDVDGSGRFSGDLRIESTNPRIYLTDTDNNPDYFISNTDGTFTVYDVTNSTSRFTIGTTGNATFTNAITGGGSITGQSLYSNGIISAGTTISAQGAYFESTTTTTEVQFKYSGVLKSKLYHHNTNNTLTLGTYNTGGNLRFEVDNNVGALTIASTGAATFSSSVAATSYSIAANGTIASNGFWGTLHTKGAGSYSDWSLINGSGNGIMWNPTGTLNMSFGGNVGIGTTGSAWNAFTALDIGANASLANYSDYTFLGTNVYYASTNNWTFKNNGYASAILLRKDDGAIQFATVGNGSAGGTASFSERMRINSVGNVLIGTTSDNGGKLQINGAVYSYGSNSTYLFTDQTTSVNWQLYANSSTARFYNSASGIVVNINQTTGAYTATSDFNKKKDIELSTLGLNEVLQLSPKQYRFKTERDDSDKHLGFIAQEVKEIIPQAYTETGEGDEKFIGLEQTAIIPVLVKAIQELKAELDTLKNK